MFVEEEASKERYVMIPSMLNRTFADRIMQSMGLEHGYDRKERGTTGTRSLEVIRDESHQGSA